jgi:predicted RNA-binding protein with PUA-like domain
VNRWLVKTDPDSYAFADLEREGTTRWEGVKNALARIHLRAMRTGDRVLVYETGGVKAVVGEAAVAKGAYPEPGAKDPKAVVVDLRAGRRFARPVAMAEARADPVLAACPLVKIGRLSVLPLTAAEWRALSGPR